jgi:threonine dehydratase
MGRGCRPGAGSPTQVIYCLSTCDGTACSRRPLPEAWRGKEGMALEVSLIQRVRPWVESRIRRTPIVRSATVDGRRMFWKMEHLQATGSFKVRGPLAVRALQTRAQRWVTASAGNHGLGIAYATQGAVPPSVVFVPRNSPQVKRDAIAHLGADLHLVETNSYDDTEAHAKRWAAENNAHFVSAFDDDVIMAGNGGTLALEILEQLPAVSCIVVPIGGGGLASGLGCAIRALQPSVRLIGVESTATAAMAESYRAGKAVLRHEGPSTLADGLAGGISERSFHYVQQWFDEIIAVEETAIAAAIAWLWRTQQVRVEGSAAVVAAAFLQRLLPEGGTTCGVFTGQNIDEAVFQRILQEAQHDA